MLISYGCRIEAGRGVIVCNIQAYFVKLNVGDIKPWYFNYKYVILCIKFYCINSLLVNGGVLTFQMRKSVEVPANNFFLQN